MSCEASIRKIDSNVMKSNITFESRMTSIFHQSKRKKSKQTKGYIRVNSLFSVNNRIKMFCSGAGLIYDEDNVSKFCVIRQGIIKHLFGRGLAENENILCSVKKYWTRRCLVQYFFPKHNIFSY